MKITKRQLKRIIAEEYALVHGKRKPVSKKIDRRRKVNEAKRTKALREARRRDLINEAKAKILVEELIEEGFFSQILKGLKAGGDTAAAKAMAPLKNAKKAAEQAWGDIKTEYEKAVEDEAKEDRKKAQRAALDAAPDIAGENFKKGLQQLVKIYLSGGYDEEEAQAKAGALWATAVGDAIPV